MTGDRSQLSLPALALVVGVWLGLDLRAVSLGLAAALLACGMAAGRSWGRGLAFLALGMAWTWGISDATPARPRSPLDDRPTTVTGRLLTPWHWREYSWTSQLLIERFVQGGEVARWNRRVSVALNGTAPANLPPCGAVIRAKGYVRRAPSLGDLPTLPPGPWRLSVKSARLVEVVRPPPPALVWIGRLRGALSRTLARMSSEDPGGGSALARALILGERGAVPLPWRRALRRAGLSHLLAISGLHVALVAALAFFIGAMWKRWLALALAVCAILVYVGVVGPRPSMLRAALMALIALASLLSRRPPIAANGLALAVIVLLLNHPSLIGDLGFRLTAAATAGIVHLAPRLATSWRGLRPLVVRRALAVTVAAQIATLPWALPTFHLLTPVAVVSNLLFVPWTGVTLAISIPVTVLAACWWPAGRSLVPLLDWLAAPYAALARCPPGTLLSLPIVVGSFSALAIASTLTACLLRPRRWLVWGAIVALLAAGWLARPGDPHPELVVLDVGQGDGILLRDGRNAVLIDGGGWRGSDFGGRVIVPALARLGIRRLSAMVLTHPDLDHCGGLADVAAYLRVGELWTLRNWPRSRCWEELRSDPWLEKRWLRSGERLRAGRWRFLVLAPSPGERPDDNDRSVVIEAQVLGNRVLLTGDLEKPGEETLLRRWPRRILASDVLKVAHHGSATSSSASFLAAVHPRLALISVGRFNSYHHPSPLVVQRLRKNGVRVLRTDRAGMIVLQIVAPHRWRLSLPAQPKPK